ncbi:50S ribosomal protein L15e [Candidatus Woesearchaeota archaeon]|nr:50S ribosomal protein L15e [Candidatus Woesearchaeota archaeon]
MGMYKHIRNLWKRPQANMPELMRERIIKWRKEPVTVRLEHPTRLDRARSLGYKAKPGFVVVRQKVIRGGHERPHTLGGRRPKAQRHKLSLDKSYQQIAEERANKVYPNCEVLNSYVVAKDGQYYWFEIILVDRAHPAIVNDKNISWITKKRGRVFRGLTGAGAKSRGLRRKGKGAEGLRPSKRAAHRRKVSTPKKTQYHRI